MNIILLGATGLVGNHLLTLLLSGFRSQEPIKILVLGRHKPNIESSLRNSFHHQVSFVKTDLSDELNTTELISTFLSLNASSDGLNSDVLISCLGTTIKTAGSRKAFSYVDYELVLSSANAAKSAGIKRMMFISAVNANSSSSMFYSKVKGEVEVVLKSLGFSQLIIIKPSLLMGQRQTYRFAESLSAPIMKILNPIFLGRFKKFRAIEGRDVAVCMNEQLNNLKQGLLEVYPTDY